MSDGTQLMWRNVSYGLFAILQSLALGLLFLILAEQQSLNERVNSISQRVAAIEGRLSGWIPPAKSYP